MLRKLDENLWVTEEPFSVLGLSIGSRCTVIRLADGSLWIHSPLELTPDLRDAIDALGPVSAIVTPSKVHYFYFEQWLKAFPSATAYVPPDWTRKIDSASLITLSDTPPPQWQGVLDQYVLRGSRYTKEVEFFHPASRSLILTDLAFNVPPPSSFGKRFVAAVAGMGKFGPSRFFRLTSRKAALRQTVERLLQWPFDRIIVSHGDIVESNGQQMMRETFRV